MAMTAERRKLTANAMCVTPFDENGEVDYDAFAALIDRIARAQRANCDADRSVTTLWAWKITGRPRAPMAAAGSNRGPLT